MIYQNILGIAFIITRIKLIDINLKLPAIFKSKLFIVVALIAFLVTSGLEYKQWTARKTIDNEIKALQEEERRLNEANNELKNSITFLSSPEYQEKLARMQLNLKKEGEIVVNLPNEGQQQNTETSNLQAGSNLINWWNYIFVN